jgi:glutamate 5-kinase
MRKTPYRPLVVKVGTNVITREDGLLDPETMAHIARQIAQLRARGIDVILVSSGAMAAGRATLRQSPNMANVGKRQLLAAVGQAALMAVYMELFREHGLTCAQVLATKEDFRDREHYLNMRRCFEALLQEKIIPVVNENDAVSVSELMFTDNDELAGLIASMVDADALVILTDVDGLLSGDPSDPATHVIATLDPASKDWEKYVRPETSAFGRGGMHTKCAVASKVSSLGITTHIINGKKADGLSRAIAGEEIGTTVPARKETSSVKRWVAESAGRERGTVTINQCAVDVLTSAEKAASLLPVGIVGVDGDFEKGDIVRIKSEEGKDIGLGVAQMSASSARTLMGKQKQKPLVHYDYLFLFT